MESTTKHCQPPPPILAYETSSATNTTFVHAHPSNFRDIVQHLTGSSSSFSASQPPDHHRPAAGVAAPPLHERRERAAMSMKKLELIKLNYYGSHRSNCTGLGLVSPVSTLDGMGRGGLLSPRTPTTFMNEEEEREIIAKKGFYLHPLNNVSPSNADPPQLLPLFPLHSPSSDYHDDQHHHRH